MEWILNWALSTWDAGGPWSYVMAAILIAVRLNKTGLGGVKSLGLELKGLVVDDWLGLKTIKGTVVAIGRAIADGDYTDDEINENADELLSTPKRVIVISLKIVKLVVPADLLKSAGKLLIKRYGSTPSA